MTISMPNGTYIAESDLVVGFHDGLAPLTALGTLA